MTKKLLTGLFLALFCLPLVMQAQSVGYCATEDHDPEGLLRQRLIANKEALANGLVFNRDETVYVPIKYHIIGNNDGSGYINVDRVLDMQCRLNEEYLEHDIQFFIKGDFNYFNSDDANDDPGNNDNALAFQKNQHGGGAINVFIAQNATSGNQLGGTTLGYYSGGNQDWIVMKKSEVRYGANTMPHETGHFFSLNHTFYGWDCTTYDEEVTAGNCAPVNGPCNTNDGIIPTELQDGSNCETAGDMLCDTPPDYNLGFGNGGCVYNGNACDPSGTPVEPMENNWMSYFEGCDFVFTPMQVEMMHTDYNSSARNYLRSTPTPTTDMVDGTTTLEVPANTSITDNYNYVGLDWAYVPGAAKYIVDVDLFPNFNAAPRRWVVGVSEWGVSDLNANTTYYWRVRPYNAYSTCADWSETFSFTTGTTTTNVADVEELEDWSVFPNPAAQGQTLTMSVEAGTAFDATIQVTNLAGQAVESLSQNFTAGRHQVEIATANLAAGLYFVSIHTKAGVTTKRVVITQ